MSALLRWDLRLALTPTRIRTTRWLLSLTMAPAGSGLPLRKEPALTSYSFLFVYFLTRQFQKNIYFCFIDYVKAFVWITTHWKILQEMGVPDHLTCLLRTLCAGQEATVKAGHGKTDWSKLGKEYFKAVYCLSSALLGPYHFCPLLCLFI